MKPKFLSTLPGYTAAMLRADILAGIMVAMVALPLSIAIASGADPGTGLTTAIIGSFLIMNRPGFTGGQNSRRLANYGTDTHQEDLEAVLT